MPALSRARPPAGTLRCDREGAAFDKGQEFALRRLEMLRMKSQVTRPDLYRAGVE